MVALRKMLDLIFTQDELRWVDDVLPANPLAVADSNDMNRRNCSKKSNHGSSSVELSDKREDSKTV